MALTFRSAGMKNAHRSLAAAAIFACAIVPMLAGVAAGAADSSPWAADSHAALRLIAGDNKPGTTVLRAGLEIKLDAGWKTYWRYPGDSGVPPRFDFSRSENVSATKVLYPAPLLFVDDAGNSLGYKNSVIFPLQVTAKEPGKAVKLHVKLDYAVCEKLCVPTEGAAELALSAGPSSQDALLAAAERRVPKPMSAEQAGLTVHRVSDAARPFVMVDLEAPSGQPLHVFVEGPTAEWALPIPKPVASAPPGHRQFGFELDGLPSGVDPKGKIDLIFTVIDGEHAYEIKTRLD
jgi:DsbC/DsbD-like thiol-disulfide interchange protein